MLIINLEHDGNRQTHQHRQGPLFIGRVRDDSPSFIEVRDDYISRKHLRLEEVGERRLRVENFGRNAVKLPAGHSVQQGATVEVDLPVRLGLTRTVIEIDAVPDHSDTPQSLVDTVEEESGDDLHVYDTIDRPNSCGGPFATLGEAPSPGELAQWLETLLSVQRSAVGSDNFYQETAQALVELIGLDRGLVVLLEGDQWKRKAVYTRDDEHSGEFSTSILTRVVREATTVTSHPRGTDVRESLAKLEAAVGSPILDQGKVVGMLYGSRDYVPDQSVTGIRPLDAQLVQLLAHSVTTGLNRQAMLSRLRQVEQLAAVGQALGYILHDLRGPLGNAQRLTEMLRLPGPGSISPEQQLNFIDECLAVSLELLNDSLEYCRGNVQLNVVRGSCHELLAKHLRILSTQLESMDVALSIEIPPDLKVMFDPARIARVLFNLAKNAGEALRGRTDGLVRIAASREGQTFSLTVSDNGGGLPEEVVAKLFQPFGTHGKRGGTGFGLAIAKQLVDAHAGNISVTTGSDGTCFNIELPCREDGDPPSDRGDDEVTAFDRDEERNDSLNVLVAEDGLVNQALIGGLLKEFGCTVTTAENGKLAVSEWESGEYDLVLMDVEMPEMGGLEATRTIREIETRRDHRTPIVALTAHQNDESREECGVAGMDDYLLKPPTPEALANLIAEIGKRAE